MPIHDRDRPGPGAPERAEADIPALHGRARRRTPRQCATTSPSAAQIALDCSHDDLRVLAARLVDIREEERARIARELHDELGQQLTAVKMGLAALAFGGSGGDGKPLRGKVAELTAMIEGSIDTVRRISTEMRPAVLDHLGLAQGIEWLAGDFSRLSGIPCSVSVTPPAPPVGSAVATTLFRIAQEALTNAARHSRARQVTVRLATAEGHVQLDIVDDGVGMAAAPRGGVPLRLGLLGIGERAAALGGTAVVGAAPSGGTAVRITIPLAPPPSADGP